MRVASDEDLELLNQRMMMEGSGSVFKSWRHPEAEPWFRLSEDLARIDRILAPRKIPPGAGMRRGSG